MTKASDNEFPKVILDVGTIPAAPTDDTWKLYAASGGVYAVSSNATAGPFGAGGAGSGDVATDTIWDAAGDLVQGTGANTAAKLSAGTSGMTLKSAGAAAANVWAYPPGYEFTYAEVTSGGNITATVEGSADTIVTAGAVAFDGSTVVVIEFFAMGVLSAAGETTYLVLFDGASSIGYIGQGMVALNPSMMVRRRLTPTAATHTYSMRAIVTGGTGTWTAGAGGVGANSPAYIRITKA